MTKTVEMVSFRYALEGSFSLAGWQSGYAEDCKSLYVGSIPVPASKLKKTSFQRRKSLLLRSHTKSLKTQS